jgi:hypothetical protein
VPHCKQHEQQSGSRNSYFIIFLNFYAINFFQYLFVYDIKWKITLETDRPQMPIWRMRIACWITETTAIHLEYVKLIAFPRQKWLSRRPSPSRYTYIASSQNTPITEKFWPAKTVTVHSALWSVRQPLLQYGTALWGTEISCYCCTVGGAEIDWFELRGRWECKLFILFHPLYILLCLLNTVTVIPHCPPSPHKPVPLSPSYCLNPSPHPHHIPYCSPFTPVQLTVKCLPHRFIADGAANLF